MKNIILRTISATSVILLVSYGVSYAQSVTSGQILEALKPKQTIQMSKTRSFGVQKNNEVQDNVSSSDRSFIRGLDRTRAIRVEQREKLIKIVKKSDLPSVNIRILFDYDSDRIRRGSFESLNEIGDALHNVALADSIIMLNGHTDAVGSRAYNQNLSERRAISAKRYLTEIMQVPPERLVVAGFGEERLNDPDDPANESNRRVEIINLGE